MAVSETVSAFNIVIGTIVGIAGVIITLDKVLDVLHKRNPSNSIVVRLDKHDELLQRDLEHLKKHDNEISSINITITDMQHSAYEFQVVTLESLLVLLDSHSTVEDRDEKAEMIRSYLIKKQK